MKRIVFTNNGRDTQIDPEFCEHQHTEPLIVGQPGGDVYVCLDCGEHIDPELQGINDDYDDQILTDLDWDEIEEIEF